MSAIVHSHFQPCCRERTEALAWLDRRGTSLKFFDGDEKSCLSMKQTKEMDMDHVYVNFCDFVLGHYCLAPQAVLFWLSGIICLLVRQRLQRKGLVSPKPFEPECVVAKLLLEGVGVMLNFSGTHRDG